MVRLALLALLASACEKDLVSEQPDAAPMPDSFVLPFGFDDSCVGGSPSPTTAPDPLSMTGTLGQVSANVEIRATSDDALLASGVTGSTASTSGKYTIAVSTAGVARDVYRKGTKAGYTDVYVYEPFPSYATSYLVTPLQAPPDPSFVDVWGEHPDPTKGSLTLVIYDCKAPPAGGTPVAGAKVDVPENAHALYIPADGIIGDSTKELTQTTAAGRVDISGLEPGTYDVAVHLGELTYRSRPVKVVANAWTISMRSP